jgi:hypothetical protein
MSALATIVDKLGELSESELRQLYLVIGVRLGIPDVPSGVKPQGKAAGKTRNTGPSGGKTSKKAPSSKGNPTRKSQWANHPLYQEYSRLKKVVEAQAKEVRTSFNAVDTAESRAYREAFTHWVEAKSSFRDHRKGGKEVDSEDESEEEEAGPAAKLATAPSAKAGVSAPASSPKPAVAAGKTSVDRKGKGKAT